VAEEIELFELIRRVQNGANFGFRYEILPDGRRTIRRDDEQRTPVGDVTLLDILNSDDIPVTTDTVALAAEVVVAYGESYSSGRFLRVTDDTEADAVAELYAQRPRKEYRTLLTLQSDAEERAAYAVTRFTRVRGRVTLELMGAEWLTLRIYDLLTVELTLSAAREFYGPQKVKVIAVEPDARRGVNTVEAQLVSAVQIRITESGDERITQSGVRRELEDI
jgi:hypothetical protein